MRKGASPPPPYLPKSARRIKKHIPIVLSSDNHYAPYMHITVLSALLNAHDTTVLDFYLMVSGDFSEQNKKAFWHLEKHYRCTIHFLDMKDAFSDLKMQIAHITSPTYYRLLMAELLPTKIEKCLYLDGDICVCHDLEELYQTDLENNYIGGVVAPSYYFDEKYHCARLGLDTLKKYVNAGVLIMNLSKIRKDRMTAQFMKLSKQNFASQDQDVLNVACYPKIKLLEPKYNMMTARINLTNPKLEEIFSKSQIKEAVQNPCIIHYLDKIKPWKDPLSSYAFVFWQYARQSVFYEQVLYENILSRALETKAQKARQIKLFNLFKRCTK